MNYDTTASKIDVLTQELKEWVGNYPIHLKGGEWEDNYPNWPAIEENVFRFIDSIKCSFWAEKDIENIFYIIARDNSSGKIIDHLSENKNAFFFLGKKSVFCDEIDVKWQFAMASGYFCSFKSEAETLLFELYKDESDYVRRRVLMSLEQLGSQRCSNGAQSSQR